MAFSLPVSSTFLNLILYAVVIWNVTLKRQVFESVNSYFEESSSVHEVPFVLIAIVVLSVPSVTKLAPESSVTLFTPGRAE